MTVIVETSRNLGLAQGQNRTVFRNPRGLKNYYAFYANVAGAVESEYSINGINWSNAPQQPIFFGFGSSVNALDVKIHDDGSQLEVWLVSVGEDSGTWLSMYAYGTIGDGDNDITWNVEQVIDADINDEALGEPHCISLARVDDGYLVVNFTEDYTNMGKDYRLTKIIGSDGDGIAPNWLGEQTQSDPSQNNNNQDKAEVWFATEGFSSDFPERYAFLMRFQDEVNVVDYQMGYIIEEWDGAGSWNLIEADVFGISSPGTGAVLSLLIDDNDCAYYLYESGTDDLIIRYGDQPGESTAVAIGIISWGAPFDACCLSFDGNPPVSTPSTDEVSGSWSPSAGGDLYAMVDDGYTDDDSTYIENNASDACRLGGLTGGAEYTSICVRAALTGAVGAVLKVESYKGGVLVQTLVLSKALSATIENIGLRVGLNDGDIDEIQITSILNASDSVRIYNVFVDHRKVIISYHHSNRTLDWKMLTMSPKSVASNTFTPIETVSFHETITALSCWSRAIENSLHIGGLFGSTIIYNEQPVYKALSTTLADLEFPDQNYYLGPHST
jgi:hypothetical protein